MRTRLEAAIKRYLSVVHWFIPERLQNNPLALSRSQNVVSAAAIAGISDPFYALLYYLLGFKSATPVILICGVFMVSAPFILKLTGRIKIAEQAFLCAVFYNFCWLTYHLGGVSAPTADWLIICPVVAILLGGVFTGIFWLAMSCAAIAGIYLLQVYNVPLPLSPILDVSLLRFACGLGLFIVVINLVLFFELTKTQGFIKLEQALKIIQELAIRDELTGIHNRRHILKIMDDERERIQRLPAPFCICLLDIDHFKRINDAYGHSVGDSVLTTVAKTVTSNIRNIDSFGRYGGEEFLLMFPQTDLEQATALAERVRIKIEQLTFDDVSSALTVTVSIGIAKYQPCENIIQTINRADHALYEAKYSGRNRIVVCEHDVLDVKGEEAHLFAQPADDLLEIGRSDKIENTQRQTSANENVFLMSGVGAIDGDVTQWRQACLEYYDPMTGLPNRHIFRDRLSQAMQRATRHNLTIAILAIDINKFKEVNNALGYEKGDQAIVNVAERIKLCLRECDTVSRWDGDEFSIILEDVVDENGVHGVAQKLIDEFCDPLVLDGTEYFLSVSIGVALFPDHGDEIDGLIKKADAAMLCAKAAGQNIYRFYSSDLSTVLIDPLTLKSELRHALARNELFLHYQPQVDLVSNTIIGVEALIRWRHPQFGLIMPNQFIPIAEETGMIINIGEWVLKTACIQTRQWRESGLAPIKIAVNLSASQLRDPELVERVRGIIDETGADPTKLELEITEGILIYNLERGKDVFSKLRDFGINISIDDFGMGYSSLNYLSELPLDILKLDGSFVKRLDKESLGENSYAIANSIIFMAHSMNLKVIAEVVETEEQLACLRNMQCDQIQGYLYSRPVPASEIAKMLASQNVKSEQAWQQISEAG